jgi:hypothetical protein
MGGGSEGGDDGGIISDVQRNQSIAMSRSCMYPQGADEMYEGFLYLERRGQGKGKQDKAHKALAHSECPKPDQQPSKPARNH